MRKQKFLNNLVSLQIPRKKKTKLAAKLIKQRTISPIQDWHGQEASKPETTGIPRLKPAA